MSTDSPASSAADLPPTPPKAPHPPAPAPVGSKSVEPAVGFTRAGALWSALIGGFLVLIVLLIFIAQNTESASFTFLGWHWSLPLGVAMLVAAVAGGLLTVAVGTVRIIQLRRAAKKHATALR
jgi:uncharacterized integral membrane protein